jgi:hypothetical protein
MLNKRFPTGIFIFVEYKEVKCKKGFPQEKDYENKIGNCFVNSPIITMND